MTYGKFLASGCLGEFEASHFYFIPHVLLPSSRIHLANPRFSCEYMRKHPPSDIWHSLQLLHSKGTRNSQTAAQQATSILQRF